MRPKYPCTTVIFLVILWLLTACARQPTTASDSNQNPDAAAPQQENTTNVSASSQGQEVAAIQVEPVTLDPGRGQEIGFVYEAFLSPQQEPGEEEDTPALTPEEFLSTAPSFPRNERMSYGHGMLRFTNDLSRVYVDVQVEGINAEDVNMFHIHCGRPDMLGPILIDFSFSGDLQENLADGLLSVVLTNEDIEKVSDSGHGVVGAFTAGCPVIAGLPGDVKTIAGMESIARQGELYFNLHTKGQTFYGEMRGQLHLIEN